jgi:histone H3/H4
MAKKKAPGYPTFVVKSAVKEFAKTKDMMVGSDAYDAINQKIGMMLEGASLRCKENKRKTLKAYDL